MILSRHKHQWPAENVTKLTGCAVAEDHVNLLGLSDISVFDDAKVTSLAEDQTENLLEQKPFLMALLAGTRSIKQWLSNLPKPFPFKR